MVSFIIYIIGELKKDVFLKTEDVTKDFYRQLAITSWKGQNQNFPILSTTAYLNLIPIRKLLILFATA